MYANVCRVIVTGAHNYIEPVMENVMLRSIFLVMLWGCSSDIAIITTEQKGYDDTAEVIGVGEPADDPWNPGDTDSPEPSGEPSDEMTELTIGFAEMSLTQIACPACMGETQELTVQYELQVHQPVSDSWNSWIPQDGTCDPYLYRSTPSTVPVTVMFPVTSIPALKS